MKPIQILGILFVILGLFITFRVFCSLKKHEDFPCHSNKDCPTNRHCVPVQIGYKYGICHPIEKRCKTIKDCPLGMYCDASGTCSSLGNENFTPNRAPPIHLCNKLNGMCNPPRDIGDPRDPRF